MKICECILKGAHIIELEPIYDQRGFFARAWCKNEFLKCGLKTDIVQANLAFNRERGTVRGMHFQTPPWQETKTVQCVKGSVYDVIIDLRPQSPTYLRWMGIELSDENRTVLYIPEGFAHGYQAMTDGACLFYQSTQFFAADHASGVRYDDEVFNIAWPLTARNVSEKDLSWPYYACKC